MKRSLLAGGLAALILSALPRGADAQALAMGATVGSGGTCPAGTVLAIGNNRPIYANSKGGVCIDSSGGVAPLPAPTTPAVGTNTSVATGGTAVIAVTGPVNGCYIVNPATATEVLYVNPVTTATTTPSGSNTSLAAGQSFNCVPGQTTNVSVNAATNGHTFTAVKW